MGSANTWPAPAKLNLFLHVLGRRDDGYHDLQTVFQLLDWGDEVYIEPTASGPIERLAEIPGVPLEEDLSVRAGRLLQRECAVAAGARISIRKRIPPGAGLGGASSDAATVLCVLNEAWGCNLEWASLADLGRRLGADVPVFVHGHSAWGEATGDRLRPLALGERWYVLLMPGIEVCTASVFADPRLPRGSARLEAAALGTSVDFSGCRNDCEEVALRLHPGLAEARAALSEWGEARMTGTGSAFFLPVSGEDEAVRVTTELKSRYNVRAVEGVDRSPLLAQLAGRHRDGG